MRRLDITLPPSPAPIQSTDHDDVPVIATNSSNFDTNMIIILAALLGALICAVCINSILRCTLRCCCRRGNRPITIGPPKEQQTGLTKKELRKLPTEVYRKSDENGENQVMECPICLSEFGDKEMHRVLPVCRHRFHVRCVDKWLGSNCTCPTCRRSVLPDHHVK